MTDTTVPPVVILFIAFALCLVGYCLIRGVMDWRSGNQLLGLVGITLGIGMIVLPLITRMTPRVTIDLVKR
jgi:4-amino-4-deoxy-L-arabinose transferase-like glycosyltransferase